MAKPTTIKIRLNSSAGTGHFYVTKKNARTMTEKWSHGNMILLRASMLNIKKAKLSRR